jgi:hypothetical protein
VPTPNVIKYSVSNVSNTIGRNNMHLGVSNSVGYGPTATTDFWNGYTPGPSGYTIYVNKVSNGPSIFSPANDAELINTAKYIANSINLNPTITTAGEAITWVNSQSDMICVNYDYPNIVTSGLVSFYDSSFAISYPRSGTSWMDLSNNQLTGSLINEILYLDNNGGSFNYISSDFGYVLLPDVGNLPNFTVSCWFKLLNLPTTSGEASLVTNVFGGSDINFSIGLNNSPTSANICGGFFDGSWRTTSGFIPEINKWYSVDVTYNGNEIIQYIDGVLQSSVTYSGTPQSSGLGIRIGRGWNNTEQSSDFINGQIPFVSIYDRGLSEDEIQQNYLALVERFYPPIDSDALAFINSAGITGDNQVNAINNLVLNLKSQNLWSKLVAAYPVVGGTALAHSKNLINPDTYELSFTSGWTHTSEGMYGITLGGTYADTGLAIGSTTADSHISIYCATDSNIVDYNDSYMMGTSDGYDSDGWIYTNYMNINLNESNGFNIASDYWYNNDVNYYGIVTHNTTYGHFINTSSGNRTSINSYINGILKNTAATVAGAVNYNSVLIGTMRSDYGGITPSTGKTISFVTIGSSLTPTDSFSLFSSIEEFQNSLSRGKSPENESDSDLYNFLLRTYSVGGTLSLIELNELTNLVSYLKNNGLWDKLSAVYPFIGGTSNSCAQNLINSSFTASFTSGWTFDYSGALPNGTSAYMDTGFNFLDHGIDNNSGAFGVYLNTSRADSTLKAHGAIGTSSFPSSYIFPFASNSVFAGINSSLGIDSIASSDTLGLFQTSRISSTQEIIFKNSSGTTFNSSPYPRNNFNLYIGAANVSGPTFYDSTKIAFGYVSKYALSSTDLANMYTGIQMFNSKLGRAAGKPIFEDSDVNSFFDRLYAAGGSSTGIEAVAVNNLVLELKQKGIWSQLKSLYPFVGTTSASNSINLKSSSYTGTFVGSWTYGNGVRSNGGHFNTGFVPNTDASINGFSFGGRWYGDYVPSANQRMGVLSSGNDTTFTINSASSGFTKTVTIGGSSSLSFSPTYAPIGTYIFRRTSSTFAQAHFAYATQLVSGGTITANVGSTLPTGDFYFGRYNNLGNPGGDTVTALNSVAFLGVDLTSQQASDLNTALYKYTSTVGRP